MTTKRPPVNRGLERTSASIPSRGREMSARSESVSTSSGWARWLEQEAVAATVLLQADQCAGDPAVIRFRGRRLGVGTRGDDRDRFETEEVVEGVVPGSGPIAVTTRVYDVNPGEWDVTAELVQGRVERDRRGSRGGANARALRPASWSWRRWSLSPGTPRPVETCPAPLARIGRAPGMIPGIWGAMVGTGILLAIALTAVVVAHEGLPVGRLLVGALLALLGATIGAKLWYVAQSPGRRLDGWCIQGFVAGLVLAGVPAFALLGLPVGQTLDAAAPGLFLAMALGRVGCFFAGCCVGRPTGTRWGLWSSDQRLGMRRIPTQLLESLLTATIGIVLLLVVWTPRPAPGGAILVTGIAAYTLGRQGILRLRLLPRRSTVLSVLIAAASAIVLAGGIATIAGLLRP